MTSEIFSCTKKDKRKRQQKIMAYFVQSIILYHSLDYESQKHKVKAVHFNPKKKF